MKIPMETVMKLPIQDRRYFIQKHNEEQENIKSSIDRSKDSKVYDGESINNFAKLEQTNIKNMGGR